MDDFVPLNELISLKGKVAVVTGGASGIGLATVYRLCEAGACVFITDINDTQGQQAVEGLRGKGFDVDYIHCDVSQEADVVNLMNKVVSEKKFISILVNNAGIFPRSELIDTSVQIYERVQSINVRGVLLCCREAARKMMQAGRPASIVNIASIDAIHPSSTGMAVYDASKGAVLSLTKSLAAELGKYDIRVNAIAPGGILTENVQTYMSGLNAEEGRKQLKNFMARLPLGRMGRADDIARVVLFLASELASYITGSLIVADGGYLVS